MKDPFKRKNFYLLFNLNKNLFWENVKYSDYWQNYWQKKTDKDYHVKSYLLNAGPHNFP